MKEKGEIPAKENVAGRPALLRGEWWTEFLWDLFCPGCQIPVAARVVGETLEEMGIHDRAIMICGVGCHGFLAGGFALDRLNALHGRAPDVATGIKRNRPNVPVFTIQGDGDCIAIGADSLIGALSRSEKITIFMINNTNYGTTGGQLGPTTLLGQVTTTCPSGRDPKAEGYPVHTAELVATFKGVAYSARGSLHTPRDYKKTKKYVRTAFQRQLDNVGTGFVEIIAACPVNWHMTPVESLAWIEEKVIAEYPLGEFRNVEHIE